MKKSKKGSLAAFVTLLLILFPVSILGQGYLHTDGKKIVDGEGENVILRGIGTGNWMLQEGYMMKTAGVAGTQHEFRAKLIETIGEASTDSFYNVWLRNHFTRRDVDSMKAWGFNSVRVAMHYVWFTLLIEEEPVAGENTWINKGFLMIDSLLDWCSDNETYLILDLHGAPGGQGANADISDYDPGKPSLWESQANKDKTIALWKKLAERYSDEPWIGGYDLINETNWTFPEGNNSQMRTLYGNITEAIREVDSNHIIFIEGNSFANDFSGLTPPWDDNLVYSFHRYWAGTGEDDLDWVLPIREKHNVPLWLGESGENSNTWYTETIELCESNNIGWSWWPVKKNDNNCVLKVSAVSDYERMISYWRGETTSAPTSDQAFQAVLKWADNHRIENCEVKYDVIDALIRQPFNNETLPFKDHEIDQPVFFSDYDLGKNGYAYFDKNAAYYGGDWTDWNTGWGYRSDGVDIEECADQGGITNGYNVGWTETGEWIQYTLVNQEVAAYSLDVRSAAGNSASILQLQANNGDITGNLLLPNTDGYQKWQTTTFHNIILPAGKFKLKFKIKRGGSNLNYFSFRDARSPDDIDFQSISAETSEDGTKIYLALNKEVTTSGDALSVDDFRLLINNQEVAVTAVALKDDNHYVVILTHDFPLTYKMNLNISYQGASIQSGSEYLKDFSYLAIKNNLPDRLLIPGKIQAEDYHAQSGIVLENCSEGGKNTGYTSSGDYMEYLVFITSSGTYTLNYRVATIRSDAELIFQVGQDNQFTSLDTILFIATGDWQSYTTQSTTVTLEKGYYTVRLLVKNSEHNLNWFELLKPASVENQTKAHSGFSLYPNPCRDYTLLSIDAEITGDYQVALFDMNGRLIYRLMGEESTMNISTADLEKGCYLIRIQAAGRVSTELLFIE